MLEQGIAGTLLLIFTGLTTYMGLTRPAYQDEYKFDVDRILIGKEYRRLLTCGFLHGGWLHFGFNMVALLSFSLSLEWIFGIPQFLLVYFASLLGGSLFALYMHRNHGDYTAVGASGAVSGVVAASIVLFPHSEIGLILLPGGIAAWIVGLLFIVISIFGIKSQSDNIGHDAHLGGLVTGILLTAILRPSAAVENWWVLALLLAPVSLFSYLILRRPDILITGK